MKQPSSNTGKLHQNDWDFSACPNEQLYECYCYEYARESPNFRQDVERFRTHAKPAKTFAELLSFFQSCRSCGKGDQRPQNVHSACIFNFSPEFPEMPFLSINHAERKKRVARVYDDCRGGDWMASLTNFQPLPWSNIFHWGSEEIETRRRNPHRKMVAFDINWSLSTPDLVKLFGDWIREERKREGSTPKENRGAGGSDRQFRSWLNQLGALRLLRAMNWQDAGTYLTELSGKPLYQAQARWITAKGCAEKRIERFSKESF